MNKEEIDKRIAKNREEIGRALESEMPLEFIYGRIRILSAQNERLVQQRAKIN